MSDSSDDQPLSKIKIEQDDSDSSDDAPLAVKKTKAKPKRKPAKKKTPAKKAAAKKKTTQKATTKKETTVKRQRKVYDKPGQKKDTPEELDVLRMFYESWHTEMPDHPMPEEWCMIHGIFDMKKQVQVAKKYVKTSAKTATKRKKPATKKKTTKKKTTKKKTTKKKTNTKKKPAKKKRKVKVEESDSSSEDVPLAAAAGDDDSSSEDAPLASGR